MTAPYDWRKTVLSQFQASPTLTQLLTNMAGYLDPTVNFDNFYEQVWNIDTASGWGLDRWGRILVVGRVLQLAAGTYFGFTGVTGVVNASGDSFGGGPVNPAVSPFFSGAPTTANFALTDAAYRVLLLAKAAYNITNCSIPAINQILVNLFLAPAVSGRTGNAYCTDGQDMTMTLHFAITPPLTPVEFAIISQSGVIPRPTGVAQTVVQV